jgi:hypothetical protein
MVEMRRFKSLLLIFVFLGQPIGRLSADMPAHEVAVRPSSGSAADVQIETRPPGRVQAPAQKPSWITRMLRFLQQVISGSVFF